MFLGKVVGTVVSTAKDEKLEGFKLLLVRHLDDKLNPTGGYTVVPDGVGAGTGEIVIVVAGSSARMTEHTKDKAVDTLAIGIVDSVEVEGDYLYRKD